MAYSFKPGRAIQSELRRIADRQFGAAIARLQTADDRHSDEAVFEARRHVKKVRALIRLMQPGLRTGSEGTRTRLQKVNRLLAPVADSQAALQTLGRVGRRYRKELPRRAITSARKSLRDCLVRAERQAKAERALPTAIRLLEAERLRVQAWRLRDEGFDAVRRGLKKTVRQARRAMAVALAEPNDRSYHAWRCCVKDHWFQVRLLGRQCGGAFAKDEQRLAALDACLGEHHNSTVLQDVLVGESLLPRADTARVLRIIRQYRVELRRDAKRLGDEVYAASPREVVRRAREAWESAASPRQEKAPWVRAA